MLRLVRDLCYPVRRNQDYNELIDPMYRIAGMQRLSEKQIEYTAVYVIFPQLLLGQIAVKPGYFLLFPSSVLLLLLLIAIIFLGSKKGPQVCHNVTHIL